MDGAAHCAAGLRPSAVCAPSASVLSHRRQRVVGNRGFPGQAVARSAMQGAFRPLRRIIAQSGRFAPVLIAFDGRSHAASEDNRRALDAPVALLRGGGLAADGAVEPGRDPAAVIAKAVEDRGADMLIMGAFGHSSRAATSSAA